MLQANADIDNSQTLTERQQAVLDAALRLLVE
ncbi:MAG: TetR/AcrR family transcriptional regulator, partial [Mesorhizobium sp.]